MTVRSLLLMFFLLTSQGLMYGQWVHIGGPGDVYPVSSFSNIGSTLFATTSAGVFRSTNSGMTWTKVDTGLSGLYIYDFRSLAADGEILFVGTSSGIFRSSNYGANWTPSNNGLTYTNVSSFAVSLDPFGPNHLISGTYNGVFISTDGGANWTEPSDISNKNIWSLAADGTRLVAGTGFKSLYFSTNRGVSWTLSDSGLPNDGIRSLCILGDLVFAGTDVGIFRSTNNGVSWTQRDSGLTPIAITSMVRFGTSVFAANFDQGVSLSQDSGAFWTDVSEGLTDKHVWSLFISDANLFVGTDSGRVWRRPLSQIVSSVERSFADLPVQFTLGQNYPNPFNPSTIFSFTLSSKASVVLKVYDTLAREISTIISEELSPGNYAIPWDARNLPSGVYYYRLEAGSFVKTKKLILLK